MTHSPSSENSTDTTNQILNPAPAGSASFWVLICLLALLAFGIVGLKLHPELLTKAGLQQLFAKPETMQPPQRYKIDLTPSADAAVKVAGQTFAISPAPVSASAQEASQTDTVDPGSATEAPAPAMAATAAPASGSSAAVQPAESDSAASPSDQAATTTSAIESSAPAPTVAAVQPAVSASVTSDLAQEATTPSAIESSATVQTAAKGSITSQTEPASQAIVKAPAASPPAATAVSADGVESSASSPIVADNQTVVKAAPAASPPVAAATTASAIESTSSTPTGVADQTVAKAPLAASSAAAAPTTSGIESSAPSPTAAAVKAANQALATLPAAATAVTAKDAELPVPSPMAPAAQTFSSAPKSALLLAAATVASGPASESGPNNWRVKVWHGNVRKGPSHQAKILFVVHKEDLLTVLQTEGNWHLIETADGKRGWAHRNLLAAPVPLDRSAVGSSGKRIQEITVSAVGERQRQVSITLNGNYPPHTEVLEGERPRIVCDFINTRIPRALQKKIKTNDGIVLAVRIGIHKGASPKTRVVVDLNPGHNYVVEQLLFRDRSVYSLQITAKP